MLACKYCFPYTIAPREYQLMDFGSDLLYAPEQKEKEQYEYIEESHFNHTVTGYSSVSADYEDDGEVSSALHQISPV